MCATEEKIDLHQCGQPFYFCASPKYIKSSNFVQTIYSIKVCAAYLNFLNGLLATAFFKGGGDVTNCWATCWATNWELSFGFLVMQQK